MSDSNFSDLLFVPIESKDMVKKSVITSFYKTNKDLQFKSNLKQLSTDVIKEKKIDDKEHLHPISNESNSVNEELKNENDNNNNMAIIPFENYNSFLNNIINPQMPLSSNTNNSIENETPTTITKKEEMEEKNENLNVTNDVNNNQVSIDSSDSTLASTIKHSMETKPYENVHLMESNISLKQKLDLEYFSIYYIPIYFNDEKLFKRLVTYFEALIKLKFIYWLHINNHINDKSSFSFSSIKEDEKIKSLLNTFIDNDKFILFYWNDKQSIDNRPIMVLITYFKRIMKKKLNDPTDFHFFLMELKLYNDDIEIMDDIPLSLILPIQSIEKSIPIINLFQYYWFNRYRLLIDHFKERKFQNENERIIIMNNIHSKFYNVSKVWIDFHQIFLEKLTSIATAKNQNLQNIPINNEKKFQIMWEQNSLRDDNSYYYWLLPSFSKNWNIIQHYIIPDNIIFYKIKKNKDVEISDRLKEFITERWKLLLESKYKHMATASYGSKEYQEWLNELLKNNQIKEPLLLFIDFYKDYFYIETKTIQFYDFVIEDYKNIYDRLSLSRFSKQLPIIPVEYYMENIEGDRWWIYFIKEFHYITVSTRSFQEKIELLRVQTYNYKLFMEAKNEFFQNVYSGFSVEQLKQWKDDIQQKSIPTLIHDYHLWKMIVENDPNQHSKEHLFELMDNEINEIVGTSIDPSIIEPIPKEYYDSTFHFEYDTYLEKRQEKIDQFKKHKK